MKIKKILLAILICVLFGACSSVKTVVLDESVPPEQRSRLNIGYDPLIGSSDSSAVIVYDSKPVVWNGPNYAVYIPSGKHSFLVKYSGRSSGGETAGTVAGAVAGGAVGFAGGLVLEVLTLGLAQGAFLAGGIEAGAEIGGGIGGEIGSGIDDAVAAEKSRAASEAALKAAEEAAGGIGSPIIMVIKLPSGYLTTHLPNTEFAPGETYRLREPNLLRRDWINKTKF